MIPMRASSGAIELVKRFEGCKLTAYQDVVGVWTIGYGSTSCVQPHETITQAQADARLNVDLQTAADCVERKVGIHLTQNQFDALCSFVFNLGCRAFCGSTLLRLLNAGEVKTAADEFLKWNRAGGRVLAGLTARREAERTYFLS